MSLREQLISAGLVRPKCIAVESILARIRADARTYIANAERVMIRLERKRKFAMGLERVIADARRPRITGGTTGEAKLKSAAGHDSRGKYKVSGPATPFGQPGRSTKASQR